MIDNDSRFIPDFYIKELIELTINKQIDWKFYNIDEYGVILIAAYNHNLMRICSNKFSYYVKDKDTFLYDYYYQLIIDHCSSTTLQCESSKELYIQALDYVIERERKCF